MTVIAGAFQLNLPFDLTGAPDHRLARIFPNHWEIVVQQLIGVAHQKLAGMKGVPRCTLRMLEAMLDRVGPHSNRVWPSEEFVQIWIEENTEGGVSVAPSTRSLQRAKAALQKIGVRRIIDPAEIMAGPGPHQFPEDLHRGDGVVPVWDLAGLFALLPQQFLDMLSRVSLPPFIETSHPPPADLYNVSIENNSDQTQRGTGGGEAPDFTAPELARIKEDAAGPAFRPILRSEIEGKAAGEVVSEGCRIARSAGEDTLLRAHELRSRDPLPPASLSDEDAAAVELLAAVPRLRPTNARRWIRDMGIVWCRQLVKYAAFESRKRNLSLAGGWMHRTYENYFLEKKAGKRISWPDDFVIELSRDRAKADREAIPVAQSETIPGSGLTASQIEAQRALAAIERPPELVAVWRKFEVLAAHRLPTPTFHFFVRGALTPIAWDPVTRQAILLCATESGRQKLHGSYVDKLGEILQEALGIPVAQTVRVRLVSEIPQRKE